MGNENEFGMGCNNGIGEPEGGFGAAAESGRGITETRIPATADELRAEIRRTRERIVDIIVETEYIRLQEIPAIQRDYAIRIGGWEVQLLEAEYACRRAKRKLAIVQAHANEGSSMEESAVEEQLDGEFQAWSDRVSDAVSKQRDMLVMAAGMTRMNPAEARRVKQVYRTLCKRFHPDLAGEDMESLTMFMIAKASYKLGDLARLEAIEMSTRGLEKSEPDLDGMDESELATALELIRIQLSMMEKQRDELRKDPIFELGRDLANPVKLEERISVFRKGIEEFDASRKEYERKLKELMDGEGR